MLATAQLPEQCAQDAEACGGDGRYVHLSVPTTITGGGDALWDLGFLRRRVIVSQNVTIQSMRLRGLVSGTAPYVLWFFFTADADLLCDGCTIEHDCAGGNASYFLQDVGLAALSQDTVTVSEDGMRAWGTVPMRAQDAALGTTSGQLFRNSTWVCTPAAPPEPGHAVRPDTTLRPAESCQFAVNEGRSYRGTQNFTRSGHACQRWDATEPVFHDRTPARYPAAGLVDNYCRNPDDGAEVWCYTVGGPRREPCGVPFCEDEAPAPRGSEAAGPVEGDGAMKKQRMAAIIGITSTAVVVAVFAIVLVSCMAFRRLRRDHRERAPARKFSDSAPLPGNPLVISDAGSNAQWVQSQSTTADGGQQLSAHSSSDRNTSPTADASGTLPHATHPVFAAPRHLWFGSSISTLHSGPPRDPRLSERLTWVTQPAECVRVWTPPTRGEPAVTTSAPTGSSMWGPGAGAGTGTPGRTGGEADGTTMRTRDGTLPSSSAWTALALTPSSPPTQVLEAQLEWLSCHNDGRFLGYLRLAPYLGLRAGGQGAVAFAQHQHAVTRLFAIKFFYSEEAFQIERQASLLPELRALMPPVEVTEERPEALEAATAAMPWPLCARPLPPMIVTEKGESLADFVRRSAPDFFTSLQVMVHIAEKLQQLHAAGWAHRDLKPGNAIWLPSQNSWTLIDFGCAARIGEEAPVGFSLYYAPPEVVAAYDAGCKTTLCAAAVDVWALGVVCWELLTKERFYGAGARSHAVIAQLCGRAALPTEAALCSDLCRRLGGSRICASILSMLSRAPDRRPAVGALLRQWKAAFGQADVDGDTPSGLDA